MQDSPWAIQQVQALKAAGHSAADIDAPGWERTVRDSGAHSKQEEMQVAISVV